MAETAVANGEERFDMETLYSCYESALTADKEDVQVEAFVRGYKQICLLFGSLGRVFGFMSSDIVEKMKIITQLRTNEENGKNYETLSAMLAYEAQIGLIPTTTKKADSGVRAYTRLHRGLGFVAELFAKLPEAKENDPVGPIAKQAYEKTLSNFHPWLIQTGVSVALRTLPNTLPLAINLNIVPKDCTTIDAERRERLRSVAKTVRAVYDLGEKLLGDAKCLDLP